MAVLWASQAFGGTSFGVEGLNLNAFGTFSAVHSDYDEADYVSNSYFRAQGAGYTHTWALDQDTRLGLQLTYDVTHKLSAIVQVISQRQPNNSFAPRFEWANLKYKVTGDLDVHLGRVLLPTYLTSETQNVGYSSFWVRTPAEIFFMLPTNHLDGVEVTYHRRFGSISSETQLLYGSNKGALVGGYTYENTGIVAGAESIRYGATSVHLGYQRMGYTFSQTAAIRPDETFDCFELGATYDPGGWYVTGELFNGEDSQLGHTRSFYFGAGYRFRGLTPYVLLASQHQVSPGSLAQTSGPGPAEQQRSTAMGVRWDVATGVDLKVQYDRVKLGSVLIPISFAKVQPGARVGDIANVVTLAVDFMW